jgi:hypothetical protein
MAAAKPPAPTIRPAAALIKHAAQLDAARQRVGEAKIAWDKGEDPERLVRALDDLRALERGWS